MYDINVINVEQHKQRVKDNLSTFLHHSIITEPTFIETEYTSFESSIIIQISPDELMSREKLLVNFIHILSMVHYNENNALLADINDCLAKLNYKERIYPYALNLGKFKFAIANID